MIDFFDSFKSLTTYEEAETIAFFVKSLFGISIFLVLSSIVVALLALTIKGRKKKQQYLLGTTFFASLFVVCGIFFGYCVGLFNLHEDEFLNGNRYIGIFDQNMSGEGAEYDESGYVVRCGRYNESKLTGYGREYKLYDAGTDNEHLEIFYEGEYIDGIPNGDGIFYDYVADMNQISFSGNMVNGVLNEKGKLFVYREDGKIKEKYEGCFSDGLKSGYGINVVYNIYGFIIERYEGNYYKNEKYGSGIYEYYEDDIEKVYCGYFRYDVFQGEGVVYNKYREILEAGIFEDGKLSESKDVA